MIPSYEDPLFGDPTLQPEAPLGESPLAFGAPPVELPPEQFGEPPADFAPYPQGQESPLAFEGEELDEVTKLVRSAFEAARSAKSQIDGNVVDMRKYLSMQKVREPRLADGTPAPQGTPNVVTPLTASKIHGLASTAEQVLFKAQPFFSASAHTGPAQKKARPREAALEHELQRTGTRDQLRICAAWEVFQVHAGVMDIDVVPDDTSPGEWRVVGQAVPIEDFYLWPTNEMSIGKYTTTFRRLRMTGGYLRDMADQGYYDPEAVEKTLNQSTASPTPGEEIAGTGGSSGLNGTDLEIYEYFRFWMRYKGQLYAGYYCHSSDHILRIEPNPHSFPIVVDGEQIQFTLDRPPQAIMQAIPLIGSAFSLPPSIFAQKFQELNDDLFNAMVTELRNTGQFVAFTTDANLVNNFVGRTISPGVYLSDRPPSEDNLRVVQYQLNPSIIQGMGVVQQQADQAVPSTPSIPPGTRQVSAAVNIWAQGASARLTSMITNVNVGLTDFANIYWELYRAYNITGVKPVYKNSFSGRPGEIMLLGTEDRNIEIPDLEATQERTQAIIEMVRTLGMPEQIGIDMAEGMPPKMDKLRIHSAFSDDLTWRVTGTQTIPERVQRIQNLQVALQTVPLIMAVKKNNPARSLWELLQKFYEALGIDDWYDILGEAPDSLDEADAAHIMQILQSMSYNRYAVFGENATPNG